MKGRLLVEFIYKNRIKLYLLCGIICVIFFIVEMLNNWKTFCYVPLYILFYVAVMVAERSTIMGDLGLGKKYTLFQYVCSFVTGSGLLLGSILVYMFNVYKNHWAIICVSLALIALAANSSVMHNKVCKD